MDCLATFLDETQGDNSGLVVVILVLTRFGHRPLFPVAPKIAGAVKTEEEERILAEAARDYLSQLRPIRSQFCLISRTKNQYENKIIP
jgi:hypothetical protein